MFNINPNPLRLPLVTYSLAALPLPYPQLFLLMNLAIHPKPFSKEGASQ